MDTLGLLLLAVLAALLLYFFLRRRPGRRPGESANDRLDTVAAWPPKTTRVLTTAERMAYSTLVRALPGYMILAQVPLARFIKVPTRHSYSEWLRRLGNQCADFVVCDMSSEVIAVVNVQPPPAKMSERGHKRHKRMARVLKAADVPLHVWIDEALPSAEAAREALLPKEAEAPAQPPTFATPPEPPSASRPMPLEPRATVEEMDDRAEPTPSTWFDEFNSGPAPLPGGAPRAPR